MLVKYVASKVPTVRAYDVAENTAVCQLRCRPRHLTGDLNYEVLLAVLKLRMEARNRQPEAFNHHHHETKENQNKHSVHATSSGGQSMNSFCCGTT